MTMLLQNKVKEEEQDGSADGEQANEQEYPPLDRGMGVGLGLMAANRVLAGGYPGWIPAPGMDEWPVVEGPREVPLRDGAPSGEEASVSAASEAGVKPDARKSANTRGLDGRPPGESGPKNK